MTPQELARQAARDAGVTPLEAALAAAFSAQHRHQHPPRWAVVELEEVAARVGAAMGKRRGAPAGCQQKEDQPS